MLFEYLAQCVQILPTGCEVAKDSFLAGFLGTTMFGIDSLKSLMRHFVNELSQTFPQELALAALTKLLASTLGVSSKISKRLKLTVGSARQTLVLLSELLKVGRERFIKSLFSIFLTRLSFG